MYFYFSRQFKKDLDKLKREDKNLPAKVWELVKSIDDNPDSGIGKPEKLKGKLSGYSSRRINQKHRLIYRIEDNTVQLVSCFGHYDE